MPDASSNIRHLPKYKTGDRVFVSLTTGPRTGQVLSHHEPGDGLVAYTIKLERDGALAIASENAVERILIVPPESDVKLPLAAARSNGSIRPAENQQRQQDQE